MKKTEVRYVSIDAGGTYIKYAWMNPDGSIYSMGSEPTPRESKEAFLAVIQKIWNAYEGEKGGIALSLPGTIDVTTGYIYQGGSLTYHNGYNIKEAYENIFSTRVEVENDARCACIAEMTSGNMKDVANGIVLTFGTGIGGCFVINHQIYKGTHLISGEVSMLVCKDIETYGMEAVFGLIGGIPNLCHRICEAKQVEDTDGKTVFTWIEQKDPIAQGIFQSYCKEIAIQLFNMQIMLDPSVVCIGGGVSENMVFVEGIREAMHQFYAKLPIRVPPIALESCKYHNQANVLGAFYHFQSRQS